MLLPHKILVSAKGDIMDTNLIKKKIFDQDIKQSKELPRFRYKLDLPEQKMLLCFFGQLKQDQDVFNPEFIPADDIIKYCGFEGTNPHQIIRTTAKRLSEKSIEYINGKEFIYVPWFRYIHYKNGIVSYQLNDAIKTELLQLYQNKKIYINIDPGILPKFRNNYALRLYLVFKGDVATHKMDIKYSLDEICYMLTLSHAYNPNENENAAANQKIKIIEPAIEEINSVSEMKISYEPVKFARKVIGWQFNIETTEEQKPTEALPETEYEQKETYGLPEDILEKIHNAPSWPRIIELAKSQSVRMTAIYILRYASETKKEALRKYSKAYMYAKREEYDINFQIMLIEIHGIQTLEDPV